MSLTPVTRLTSLRTLLAVVSVMLVFQISACGWHLAGTSSQSVELGPVYVKAGEGSAMQEALQRLLRNLKTSSDPKRAITVEIVSENKTTSVATVDNSGKTSAFNLGYVVEFILIDAAGQALTEPTKLSTTRVFEDSGTVVLGKRAEQQTSYQEMQDELSRRILNRVDAALRNSAAH